MNTDALLADLKQEEGWRPLPYRDHRKFWTIGYGFLIDARKGGGLPRPVAEFWLRYAVNERIEAFRKLWPEFDSQPEGVQHALGAMAYQMGADGLFGFKNMLAALKAGDRARAADEALNSEWSKQTPKRARRMANLIRG